MRWKSMLLTIVVNIFLMLMVTLMMEYADLSERFISVEDSVQEAMDMSIAASVKSEEFFTAKYQSEALSYASSSSTLGSLEVTTLVWVDSAKSFYRINTYGLAMFYKDYGRLPSTTLEVNTANNYLSSGSAIGGAKKVFEFLYGEVATDYNNGNLAWANRNWSRKIEYSSVSGIASGRSPYTITKFNQNFKEYFDSVGKLQMTTGYLKEKNGTNSYKLSLTEYPALANMGFSWMTTYNSTTSNKTSDNLSSSCHVGKTRLGSKKTLYFLTPASLGVTYIPTEVLKPSFVANLDTLVRLNKLGGTRHDTSALNVESTLLSASECIPTDVHVSNPSGGTTNRTHTSSYGQDIVTDGMVEYDLSTAKVKIDYFYFDFGNLSLRTTAEKVVSKLNGAIQRLGASPYTEDQSRQETLTRFLANEEDSGSYVQNINAGTFSGSYNNTRNGRIVAKATVRIKVHVPYKSSIMQWMCEMTGTNHYDIKLWNPTLNRVDVTSDGIWYQYSTYYCTSRS